MYTLIAYSFNQIGEGTKTFLMKYRTTYLYKTEHPPPLTTKVSFCILGLFTKLKIDFLEFVVDTISGLQLVLDLIKLCTVAILSTGGLPHPVYRMIRTRV